MMFYSLKLRISCLLLAVVIALSSCATVIGPDMFGHERSTLSSIAVSVGDFAPGGATAKNADPNKSAIQAGLVGVAPAGIGAGAVAASSVCSTPWTAGVCAIYLGLFGLMAAVGTVNTVETFNAEKMKAQAQKTLAVAVNDSAIQDTLVTRVIGYGKKTAQRDFFQASIKSGMPDADLEVALIKVDGLALREERFFLPDTYREYSITIDARARLKRRSDGTVLADRTYHYVSAPRNPQKWAENNGTPLLSEIDYGYGQLAEWIVDEYFLGQFVPNPDFPQPLEPTVKTCFIPIGNCLTTGLSILPVETLRPKLRWSFNTDTLKENSSVKALDIPKVYYEVRVFPSREILTNSRGGKDRIVMSLPVYTRGGLVNESHTLEEGLAPCAVYFWTVRAIVEEAGSIRASEWAINPPFKFSAFKYDTLHPPPWLANVTEVDPFLFHHKRLVEFTYPFSTPCEGKPSEAIKEEKQR
jgi:hypothetical protein